jgi:hypothetical protein
LADFLFVAGLSTGCWRLLYLFYLLLTCSTVVDWFYLFMPGVLFVAKIF